MSKTNRNLLDLIVKQSSTNDRVALNSIFKYVLLMTSQKEFGAINNLLKDVDPALFPVSVALGFLTSTYLSRRQFSNRLDLLKRTREHFLTKLPQHKIAALLKGLE